MKLLTTLRLSFEDERKETANSFIYTKHKHGFLVPTRGLHSKNDITLLISSSDMTIGRSKLIILLKSLIVENTEI